MEHEIAALKAKLTTAEDRVKELEASKVSQTKSMIQLVAKMMLTGHDVDQPWQLPFLSKFNLKMFHCVTSRKPFYCFRHSERKVPFTKDTQSYVQYNQEELLFSYYRFSL